MDLVIPSTDSSKLNELLDSEEPDLEEIMDEECLISEIKYFNEKLVDYLCQPAIIELLINYITKIPRDVSFDINEPRREEKKNKYPFVACEILSVANDSIAQSLIGGGSDSLDVSFKSETKAAKVSFWKQVQNAIISISKGEIPILNSQENIKLEQKNGIQMMISPPIIKFLRFLDSPMPLNLTLTGYFAKVVRSLLHFKSEQIASLLFTSYIYFTHKLASHLYSDSIQELLSIIIKLETPFFKKNPNAYYVSQRKVLVSKVIANLHDRPYQKDQEELRSSTLTNTSNLLAGLVSSYKSYVNGEEIVSVLIESSNVKIFLKGLKDLTQVSIMAPLIRQLCEYFINKYAPSKKPAILKLPFSEDVIVEAKVPSSEVFITEVTKSILGISNIIKIENQILNPQLISFQYGKANYAFGQPRMRLLEVVYWFIRLRNAKIDQEIITNGLLKSMLSLFTKNPWSNIIHMTLLRIFAFIIDYGSDFLIDNLFGQSEVLRFIIQAADNSEFEMNSKSRAKIQKGYMAYLCVLSNIIDESDNATIKYYCMNSRRWQNFKETTLKDANKKASVTFDGDEEAKRQFSLSPGMGAAKIDDSMDMEASKGENLGEAADMGGLDTKIAIEGIAFEEVKFDLSTRRIWDSLQHYKPRRNDDEVEELLETAELLNSRDAVYIDSKDREHLLLTSDQPDSKDREQLLLTSGQPTHTDSEPQKQEQEHNGEQDHQKEEISEVPADIHIDVRLQRMGSPKLESVKIPSKDALDKMDELKID